MSDACLPSGVPIQVHALVGPTAGKPDQSSFRVREDNVIEVLRDDDTLSARVDSVSQYKSTPDLERTIQPLVASCVEGVNVSVLAIGSSEAHKDGLLLSSVYGQSLASAVFQAIRTELDERASRYAAAKSAAVGSSSSNQSQSASQRIIALRYSLRISFAEIYQESIADLLAPSIDANQITSEADPPQSPTLSPQPHPVLGVCVQNLTLSPPLTSSSAFDQLIEAGLDARRSEADTNGSDNSGVMLRITVAQVLLLQDGSQQETTSCFDMFELPATNPLARPSSCVRLEESALGHQSLIATAAVIEALAKCDDLRVRGARSLRDTRSIPDALSDPLDRLAAAPFAASILSQLLQETLGGTCLTMSVAFVSPGDFAGSKATLQLAQSLTRVHNFPVTNSSTIQGIRWRHLAHLSALKSDLAVRRRRPSSRGSLVPGDEMARVLEENRTMRDDRQQLLAAMSALKTKYRGLFDDEIGVRKELLACEQDKLALSRAFVHLQQDKTQQLQALDAARFEVEHKLIEAERMVLEIQADDSSKAAQIEELCAKLGELVKEKAALADDLARVQSHAKSQETELEKEARKNQQLSLELIVAVNQKTKLQAEREAVDVERRAGGGRLEAVERELDTLQSNHRELQAKCATLESQADEARRDVVRKELELERLALASETQRLQRETATRSDDQQLSSQSDKLASALEAERAVFGAERRALALQLERALVESKQLTRDKEGLVAAWMAKAGETEELRVRGERLSAKAQAQVELFRSKLERLVDGKGSVDGAGRALGELVQSFQSREKKLRSELERSEGDKLALLRRLHARSGLLSVGERRRPPTSFGDDETPDADGAASVETESAEELIDELKQARERLVQSEQRVVDEQDARASLTLEVTELERKNAQLEGECERLERTSRELERLVESLKRELEAGSRTRDADATAGIAKMHEALVQQVDEVRRLTLAAGQQQLRADEEAKQVDRGFASTSREGLSRVATRDDQLKALLEENRQLTSRLRDGKAQWVTALEETERRCAALLTKSVMFEEENQHLRQRVMMLMANAP